MALRSVQISTDILSVCSSHALSNEHEEVAGVLLGEWTKESGATAIVHEFIAMPRKERKRDRVELSETDLVDVQKRYAHRKLKIIGWFHSHPHITVLPSHVDVRTQLRYQQFDQRFFGMITSCFNPNPKMSFELEHIAFQASPESERVDIPLQVRSRITDAPPMMGSETLARSLRTLVEEERKLAEDHRGSGSAGSLMHVLGTYQKNVAKIIEYHLDPTLRRLQEELEDRRRLYKSSHR